MKGGSALKGKDEGRGPSRFGVFEVVRLLGATVAFSAGVTAVALHCVRAAAAALSAWL